MRLLLNYFARLRRRSLGLGQRAVIRKKNVDSREELKVDREKRGLELRTQLESDDKEDDRGCKRHPSMLQAPMPGAVVVSAEALLAHLLDRQRLLLCWAQPVVTEHRDKRNRDQSRRDQRRRHHDRQRNHELAGVLG